MCLALKALNPVLIVVWVHLPLPDERASVKQGGSLLELFWEAEELPLQGASATVQD